MKTMKSFLYFVPIFAVLALVVWANEAVTVHTMNGVDATARARTYPVFSETYDGQPTGRFLIPGASTTFWSTPIDVRGMKTLVLQRTLGTIAATTATIQTSTMVVLGTPIAYTYDDIINNVTPLNTPGGWNCAIIPMSFPEVTRGTFWSGSTSGAKYGFVERPSIVSVTSGLHRLDVRGIAWVAFNMAKQGGRYGATENVFYYAEK